MHRARDPVIFLLPPVDRDWETEEEPEGEGAGLEVTGEKRPGNLIKALDEDEEEGTKKSSGKDLHRQANYSAPSLPRVSKLTEIDLVNRQEAVHNNMTAQLKSTLKRLGNEIDIKRNNVRSSLITETGLGENEDDEA